MSTTPADNTALLAELAQQRQEIKRLSELEERLNATIDSIAGIHWWKDINGVYRGCNQAMVVALGLNSRDDIIGKTDYELPWAEQAEELVENDKIVMETGQIQRGKEEHVKDKQGTVRIFMVAKSPIFDKTGKVIGTVGNSIDITHQKQLEEDLRVAKEVAEANDLKTRFIQDMQHDVRTPLSGIYQYMAIWAAEETEPEKIEDANLMKASAGQLLNMCNEIVDFESIDYLDNMIKLDPVETIRFLSRIVDLNKAAAHMRGVTLHLKIDPDIPERLKLDRKKLYRVLVNLVGNALKFTNAGGSVTLSAKLLRKDASTATVAFEVTDTGIGIPPDKIGLIFDKFVRLNPANQAKYKGSGIGLAFVKKFIDDMGATIDVESTVGEGSTFRVTLTLPIPTPQEKITYDQHEIDTFNAEVVSSEIGKLSTQATIKSTATTTPASNSNKSTILLIEDNAMLQKMIATTLNKAGGNVVMVVDSVTKAQHAIMEKSYDIIVCDLGIVGGTGLDVIQWVKQNKEHPNQTTPCVVLTANNDDNMRKTALECGFLDVFQKPMPDAVARELITKYGQATSTASPLDHVIDLDASMQATGDTDTVKEIFAMLSDSILEDKKQFMTYYQENNIEETRKILHRLDGTLRYCVIPHLENARANLHHAIQNTQQLTTLQPLYDEFYHQIDQFLLAYTKLKADKMI